MDVSLTLLLRSRRIVVSPETGATLWYAELMDNRFLPGCGISMEKLSSPRRLEIVLNDALRFDNPGRYTVSVKTRRITKSSTDGSQPSEPLSLSTTAISFELQSMSEEDEAKEVKRLSDLLDTTRNSRDDEVPRRLSYLTGDVSTREKVRRFLNSEQRPNNYGPHIYYGLFIARNRSLVLKLIEAARRDPNTPVTSEMVSAAVRLRKLATYGLSSKPVGPTLRSKTAVLVRFAMSNIYGELLQLYQQTRTTLPRDGRAGLLAYFAKHNDREAGPLIEQAVAELKPGEYPHILSDVAALHYSESMSVLLKKIVQTDDPAMVSHAAYLIGKHGAPGDEKLLEARLKRWQEQWRDRIVEADAQSQGQSRGN